MDLLEQLKLFKQGFSDDYGLGDEDARDAKNVLRELRGQQKESPKMQEMMAAHTPQHRLREVLGNVDPQAKKVRQELDMDYRQDMPRAYRAGQIAGTVAGDLTQDTTRRFYWLLNAVQATGAVINEEALALANPNLYSREPVYMLDDKITTDPTGTAIPRPSKESNLASSLGIIKQIGDKQRAKRGYQFDEKLGTYTRRKHQPGHIASLAIPSGIAINTGIGLMTPFGGAEGYKAAMPSEEDPTKTQNVLGEIALKYVMGRTGQLLPYNEFKQVRPDVSEDEYRRYQAFKFDKREDWNPTDGDFTLMAGALKGTDEGIHGPEVQFLGRSLPVTTGIVPYASAVAGGALGVRGKRPIIQGFLGGMGGLAAGQVGGNAIEQERRRRNAAENGIELN